jgi:glycosyltransferase involved in cell wall biosynthesis
MRLIIVTDYPNINGGAGKVALESAIALVPQLESVHVFTTIGDIPEDLKTKVSISTLHQTKITEQPMKQSIVGGLWNKEAEAAFSQLLDQYDPKETVVHIHSWRDGTTLSFVPEMRRRGFNFVVTAHDYGLSCPLAGFYDERQQKVCDRKGLSAACICARCTNGLFIKKSWFVLRHAYQVHKAHLPAALKHLIVVGPLNERIIRPYLPKETKIHEVLNPIASANLGRSEAELNQEFVYIGRLSPEKGCELPIRIAHDSYIPLRVVGSGVMEAELREKYPSIKFEGWCDRERTVQILRESRALVFPSVWYEAQGMVVDEAAANGIPVIVSNVTAAVDTVEKFKHGCTFISGDAGHLKTRMREFENDDRIRDFSKNGYENYWKNPPTMESHTERLLEVYSEVLAS